MTSEFKVGMMLFAAVGLMVTFTLSTSSFFQHKGAYSVQFPRIARLKSGDPVTYNGVQVGKISGVEPVLKDGSAVVIVQFSIDSGMGGKVLIGKDSRYAIHQGILGGAELEIISQGGQPITPEGLKDVVGAEPISLDDVFRTVETVVEENRAGLKKAVDAFGQAGTDVSSLSKHLDEVVGENREQIRTTVKNLGDAGGSIHQAIEENRENLRGAVDNFRIMSRQIADLVDENRPAVKQALAEFGRASTNVADVAKRLDGVVEENRANFKQTIDGFAALGKRLDAISANLDTITGQVAQGRGTLGKLVMDDTLATKTEGVLDSASQRLEEIKPLTSGLSDIKFYVGLAAGSNLHSGSSTGEAYLRIEPRPWKYYEAGVVYRTPPSDRNTIDDDPNKLNIDLNLKFGWRFFRDDDAQKYWLSVAGGLFETRLGAEASSPLTSDLSLHLLLRQKQNTREPNDRRFEDGDMLYRGWAEYRVWGRISVIAGVDDWEHPGAWVGLRGELRDDDIRNLATASSIAR